MSKYQCVSVLGGWVTEDMETSVKFGPVFNAVSDLWDWQRDNLPKKTRPLYVELAHCIAARLNCLSDLELGTCHESFIPLREEWRDKWTDKAESLVKEHMPSGGGFDSGTELDFSLSTPEKLIFHTSFHHMVDGMYDGWTEHTVKVQPSFIHGIDMSISGRNRREIKDYIAESFHTSLFTPISE